MMQLIVLWVAWCLLHSLLITSFFRDAIEKKGGAWLGLYRIAYVIIAIATLLPLLIYTASLPQHPFNTPSLWIRAGQYLLFLYALIMLIGGTRSYDLLSFLGIRQWSDYRAGRVHISPGIHTKECSSISAILGTVAALPCCGRCRP